MPVYQYACPDCGYKFELKQKFTDDPVKKCPNCDRRHVYRVVGHVAVSFKGSGWYITDSKSSGSDKKTLEHRPKEKVENAASGNGTSEGARTETAETKPEPAKKAETESKPAAKESGEKPASKAAEKD
jgi:putative FmdB family regulatory protein